MNTTRSHLVISGVWSKSNIRVWSSQLKLADSLLYLELHVRQEPFIPRNTLLKCGKRNSHINCFKKLLVHQVQKVLHRGEYASERRATIYAPSFSWAAWLEPVYHPLPKLKFFPGRAACEVVKMHATVPIPNPYGQISDAHTRLQGVLISFEPIYTRVRSHELSGDVDERDFYNASSGGTRVKTPQISFDI